MLSVWGRGVKLIKKYKTRCVEEASGPRCLRRIVVEPTDHVVIKAKVFVQINGSPHKFAPYKCYRINKLCKCISYDSSKN
jgi:hypothetical protein